MPFIENVVEAVKHAVGKIVSVGATAALSALASAYLANPSAGIQLLVVVAAYAFWSQGIVPVVNEIFAAILPKSTGLAKGKATEYFSLLP